MAGCKCSGITDMNLWFSSGLEDELLLVVGGGGAAAPFPLVMKVARVLLFDERRERTPLVAIMGLLAVK